MLSPTEADGETPDVRTQILDAATALFAASGFDGTSLQEIADVVGVAKPSLLYHFPSKDALRQAVVEQVLAHWNDVLPQLLQAATGGVDRFESLIREVVGFFEAKPARARLVAREMLDRPDEMKARFAEHLAPWLDILANFIARGQQERSVHPDIDPKAYMLQVIIQVIAGFALADVFDGLLDAEPAQARQRRIDETIRAARAALFIHPDAAHADAAHRDTVASDDSDTSQSR